MRRERTDTELDIIDLVSLCSSCMCILAVPGFAMGMRLLCGTHSKMWAIIFSHLHIIVSSVHMSIFYCFLSCSIQNSLICCWYISSFNLDIHCYPDLDLCTCISLTVSLSVSWLASIIILIYLPFLSFPLSHGRPVNLTRKQFILSPKSFYNLFHHPCSHSSIVLIPW